MTELKRRSKKIELESPFGDSPLEIKSESNNLYLTIGNQAFRVPEEGRDLIIEAIEDVCR